MRIAYLVDSPASTSSEACGVGDYTHKLCDYLGSLSIEARVFDRKEWNERGTLGLLRDIKDFQPDILHLQYPTIGYVRAFVLPLVGIVSPAPHVVLTAHEFSQAHPVRRACIGRMAAYSNAVIFPSVYERNSFVARHPQHEAISTVIPIGSNIEPCTSDRPEGGSTNTVAYFGQIRPEKGIEDFVSLAEISTERDSRFRFMIVGTPHPNHTAYYSSLRAHTSELPIAWAVGNPAENVRNILGTCRYAYLPFPDGASERRGSLLAVLGIGLAVITTRGTQTPKEFAEIATFAESPPDAFAKLQMLAESSEERENKISAGRRYVETFSWDQITQRHMTVYRKMVQVSPVRKNASARCGWKSPAKAYPRDRFSARFHPERGSTALRFSDKYLGIPLVFLLGVFKRTQPIPQNVNRLALIKTAAIGDTILISGVVKDIRQKYPSVEIVLFTGSSNIEAAQLLDGIDEIIQLPIRRPLAARRLIRRAGSFDALIEFGPWPRLDALFSFFARAKTKIGFKTKGQFRHYVYTAPVPHSSYVHEAQNFKNLLKPLKIPDVNPPSISIQEKFPGPDYIVVHMFPGGSRSFLKEWPEENWIALISSLVGLGFMLYLTGAGADRERAEYVKTKVGSDSVRVTAGTMSLRETAVLLKSARLVISVDTGIMHLASALGCKLIALHGPSSPLRWGPLSKDAVVFYRNAIGPCIDLGFESKCKVNKCMRDITTDEVLKSAYQLLNRSESV